jgi:hypothetical protein
MSVHENLAQQSTKSRRLRSIAIWLPLVLVYLSMAVPDICHGVAKQLHQGKLASERAASASSGADGDPAAPGHEWLLPTARIEAALPPATRAVLWEVRKQAVDQPLHFLLTAGPIELSRYLVGVPWYGWAITPLLAYREWRQWPSKRWWDPPLDWAMLALGVIVATWRRGAARPRPAIALSEESQAVPNVCSLPALWTIARRSGCRLEPKRENLRCSNC